MRKHLLITCALFVSLAASAIDASHFASTSKLATGKWVKIAIPDDGMYQITYDELTQMGFTTPANVRVYGSGGHRLSEVMNGSVPDDLVEVPVLRSNNKICFYGRGVAELTLSTPTGTPHFSRSLNSYSFYGYYFLGEVGGTEATPSDASSTSGTGDPSVFTSYNYCYHEQELSSPGLFGKSFLGESLNCKHVSIDYSLPRLADSTVTVLTSMAAKVSQYSYINTCLHSGGAVDTVAYTGNTARISYTSSNEIYYYYATPYAKCKLTKPAEQGQIDLWLNTTNSGTAQNDKVDYFIITYQQNNELRSDCDAQTLMTIISTTASDRVAIENAPTTTMVWDITDATAPVNMPLTTYAEGMTFAPGANSSTAYYIAFDPNQTLKSIASYEQVENQNLHAMATPDMLIVTNSYFHEQAQRLADMHKSVDGITVEVIDQDKIFNEFSSGTPDAMAIRMFCKMLYTRNSSKFKNLLLFGFGSYDNRAVLESHKNCVLLYETDNSSSEYDAIGTDDFYAFLDDGTGSTLSACLPRLGVGRITCNTVEEAKTDVDKIITYYTVPDYGAWRNNTTVFSDEGDNYLHLWQADVIDGIIDNDNLTGMHVNTAHNAMYPKSIAESYITDETKRTAATAKQHLGELLKSGQYFVSYVGHAGPTTFTKYSHLWTQSDVQSNSYTHFPILSTATCDVARFDGDMRGIADLMFHKTDGGCIATLCTSRQVYPTPNHAINSAFVKALFSHATTGEFSTIGNAYMLAKQAVASKYNNNHLKWLLIGDPAIRVRYPITRCEIVTVNNINVNGGNTTKVYPLQQVTITAQVMNEDTTAIDTEFNGDAVISIYGMAKYFTNATVSSVSRNIYYERPLLAQADARVTAGKVTATLVLPENMVGRDSTGLIRIYAHKDNSDLMVNGLSYGIKLGNYTSSKAVSDNNPPEITHMYINSEEGFDEGSYVPNGSTLYITATDDYGINVQTSSIAGAMTLILDEGVASYPDVKSHYVMADEGKTVKVVYDLPTLEQGAHTLTYTVYDVANNSATRTISFVVGPDDYDATVTADAMPAYVGDAVSIDFSSTYTGTADITLHILNAIGEEVFMKSVSSFPYAWTGVDNDGNAVDPGLYRVFATFDDGNGNHGGSNIHNMVLLRKP